MTEIKKGLVGAEPTLSPDLFSLLLRLRGRAVDVDLGRAARLRLIGVGHDVQLEVRCALFAEGRHRLGRVRERRGDEDVGDPGRREPPQRVQERRDDGRAVEHVASHDQIVRAARGDGVEVRFVLPAQRQALDGTC